MHLTQIYVDGGLRSLRTQLLQEKHLERAELRRSRLRRRPSVGPGEPVQDVVAQLETGHD
jgi:hypothetical protein